MSAATGYVYAIENTRNGGMYVGSTADYKSRWRTHRSALRRGKHHSFILQKAWDKHGEVAFLFRLLVVCPRDMRVFYEQRLMPLQRYNVLRTAKETLVRGGWKHTDAFKRKMSLLHKGVSLSDEHRAKLSVAAKGRLYGPNFSLKARSRQLGVSPSEKTRRALSQAVMQARAAETEANMKIAKAVHTRCVAGEVATTVLRDIGMTPATFYKYVAKLGLPLLGHKPRGGVV